MASGAGGLMAGKGDRPRPVDAARYREGWERTFGNAPMDVLEREFRRLSRRGGPRRTDPPPVSRCVSFDIDYPALVNRAVSEGGRDPQPVRLPGDRHG